MRKTINCVGKDCSNCLKAVLVKNAPHPIDDKYSCNAYPKKHKAISAEDCGSFKCNDPNFSLCRNCVAK